MTAMMTLPKPNQYLRFEQIPSPGKTERWLVLSARSGDLLGQIRWFGRWRQYVFYPEPSTVFNPSCLDTITENIRWLMAQRRESGA